MKRTIHLLLLVCMGASPVFAKSFWERRPNTLAAISPRLPYLNNFTTYSLDETSMRAALSTCSFSEESGQTIELPMPDGTLKVFRIWANHLLTPALAAQYPSVRTYTAEALNEPTLTAKVDFTNYGFHALIFYGDKTTLVDPADNTLSGLYIVRYKGDETRPEWERMKCLTDAALHAKPKPDSVGTLKKSVNGTVLRTYRLALSCNHEYAWKVTGTKTPTKADVLSKMTTTMNRVNGIYEREVSITMTFVANETALIVTDSATDYFRGNNSNPGLLIAQNQYFTDSLIGNSNYDVGHIFSTGAGGVSSVGVICRTSFKAQSVTGSKSPMGDGFDIDYVAHEMGHEFGCDHTFNDNSVGYCGGNANQETAFESGSGSTVMAYAGICPPDDLQAHSDAYFAAISLKQITIFLNAGGGACAAATNTNNKPVSMTDYNYYYSIPFLTPFELESPMARDSVVSNSITYCWEQSDLGDFGETFANTFQYGPLFRSFSPDTSQLRVFPKMPKLFAAPQLLDDSRNENNQGEKVPSVARTMNFKLTVRNILNGHGCFLFADDSIHIDVVNTGRGFTVTSQGTTNILYLGGSEHEVTWDVVNSDRAPINARNVDIYMTTDSGKTWPYYFGNFPNTGRAVIKLPNPPTIDHARIKVKGSGNVFFNLNKYDFAVINYPDASGDILVFPVPATSTLNVVTGDKGSVATAIFTTDGKRIWQGTIDGMLNLDVSYWPRAIYFIKMIDIHNRVTVRKFVLLSGG